MTRFFSPVIGTHSDDTLTGSTGRDFISGHGGNDDIKGLGGDDILHGGNGAGTFSYSSVPEDFAVQRLLDEIFETPGDYFHDGVDAILDFSRSDGDKINLALMNASLDGRLSFTGTTRGAYSVYYESGVHVRDSPLAGQSQYNDLPGGIMLFAGLDGDEHATPDFMIAIWGVSDIAASDLI